MTYESVGVDYGAMDPFKRAAQKAARQTAGNLTRLGFSETAWSRGESAYLIEMADCYLAHVEEGLGTKNIVADAMYSLAGKSYYQNIAQDAVAMVVNDMITLGAFPVMSAMHLAVGVSSWFNDKKRWEELICGWKNACNLARCVWSGGETPTLRDVISPETFVLSGSAVGIVKPKERILAPWKIQEGDEIFLLESSGIHANGLTLAREIADKLPEGYMTKISNRQTYGEALLEPTHIYVPFVEDCINLGLDLHYAVNITGHGWRKLMRANEPFAYIIEKLPAHFEIFNIIQKYGPVGDREAYANLNMGAGFAVYLPEADVKQAQDVAYINGMRAIRAGHIERSDKKKIWIKPKGLEYFEEDLNIR